ncbi:restriction endonuclease [Shouchella patagoniensis]|uniref:restriction endonuclease n=1 Tax=Shouchella patagoniensis TaxID=228576 RepID=UPI000994EE10|nr:restriction endonuclease [Shouchella patagoniensis]
MERFEIILLMIAVIGLLMAIILIRGQLRKKKRKDVGKITIRDIDRMEGSEFEDYVAVAFAVSGFTTYQTKKSRDYGADLIVIGEDGIKTVVQVKRYGAKLGLSCVQEAYAAKAFYQAERTMVVTSAEDVTESCWQLAAATNTSFLLRADVEELAKYLRKGRLGEAGWICSSPHMPEKNEKRPALVEVEMLRNKVQAGDYYYK